jgi:hypothetical protein
VADEANEAAKDGDHLEEDLLYLTILTHCSSSHTLSIIPRLVLVTAQLLQWNQVSAALHQGWMIPVYNLTIWDPN